jgi:hypothetical protein
MTLKEKNPRRVAGQLRRMIRARKRNLWWISLFAVVPLLALIVCIYFSVSAWLIVLCSIASVSGIIQFLADLNQLFTWKTRLSAIEADSDFGNDV